MSTLAISEFVLPNCQYSGTVTLRIYYWPDFIASDSTTVIGGQVGSQNFYAEIDCTLDEIAAELTIPAFNLTTTDDPLPTGSINSTVTGVFYVNGAQRDFLFSQFTIPASLTPTAEFAALRIYNTAVILTYPSLLFLTREQVAALIAITMPALHASTHENGGSDEINVAGLSGVLADPQPPIVESVQDIVGALVQDNTEMDWTYDDALATLAVVLKAASVVYAKIQNVSATDRLLGRDTAGAGVIEELTVGGGVEFTGSGGIQTSAFTGDVTKAAGGTAQTIPNDTVTYAKMQNVSTASKLLGRGDSGSGDPEEITLGTNLSMTGTTLSAAGASGYTTVEDEGVGLTQRTTINFTGAGVSAADSGGKTVVTIAGGGSSTTFASVEKFSNL